jgi:GT2 family glycosyltransferase
MDEMDPDPVTARSVDAPAEPVRIEHPDALLTVRKRFERPLSPGWYRVEVRYGPEGLAECLVELLFEDGRSELRRLPYGGRNEVECIVRWPKGLVAVDFHLAGSRPPHRAGTFVVEPASVVLRVSALLRRGFRVLRQEPMSLGSGMIRFGLRLWRNDLALVPMSPPKPPDGDLYDRWRALFDEEPDRDRDLHEERSAALSERPRISVVCVLDVPGEAAARASLLDRQIYQNWQLILVTDRPEEAQAALGAGPLRDGRISVRGGDELDEGAKLNAGLSAVEGDFVIPLHAGLALRSNALLELALASCRVPSARMIYADEDEVSAGQRANPRFKPAWSPEAFATHDYVGDPVMMEVAAVRRLGGWRAGLGEDASYDLKLRLAAHVGPSGILHLAKLLVHRDPAPARSPDAGGGPQRTRVIEEHLAREGTAGRLIRDPRSPHPRVEYAIPVPAPLVSILIPTKDKPELLRRAVDTVLEVTRYQPLELIIMDNGSCEPRTLELFRSWDSEPRIRVVPCPGAFNFSALNNAGARLARGEILVLLNNDVEIIDPGWLGEMVGLASRPEIGCVGAKLYYPDGTIQHAGVVTGPGGGAGHSHKHASRAAKGYLDRLVTVTNVSAVTAACLAIRADLYDEVGGLDEATFPVAFNDVDFCLKVAAAGYRNVWTPFAELIHHESVSRGRDVTPEAARRFSAELTALQQRWSVRLLRDPYYSPHLTMDGEDFALRTR